MPLTYLDTQPFDRRLTRVADHLGRGDVAAAIADSTAMLESTESKELESWIQHKLAMSGIELSLQPIEYPDPAYLDWLLDETREFLHTPNVVLECVSLPPSDRTRLSFLLEWACERGNSEAVKLLVGKYGADPDAQSAPWRLGNALDQAIAGGCTEAVRWLLERGTPVNVEHRGRPVSMGLLTAAHKGRTDICQMLVERGAVVNFLNDQGLSPLSYARMASRQDAVDYLLSVGALEPWQIRGDLGPPPPPDLRSITLDDHLLRLGDVYDDMGVAAGDAARPDWPVVIRRFNANGGLLLATDGMSAVPLCSPPGTDDATAYRWGELYTYVAVPEDDDLVGGDWPEGRPEERWIAEWLIRLARYPAENGERLGPAAVLANGEPPEPLAPGVPFTCWLLVNYADKPISVWERRDGEVVRLYHAYPIHTAERDYERAHGVDALLERLAASGAAQFIDPARPSAV